MSSLIKIFIFFLIFISIKAQAYPDFIGFGYNSCIQCHFNASGGGALTDYGRGVLASEIAGRTFVSDKVSDDELAEKSGMFGKAELPNWWRPGIKARGLYYKTDPGSSKSVSDFIPMQFDISNAFLFHNDKHIIMTSIGYAPTPSSNDGSQEQKRNITSHEYYYRYQLNKSNYFYLGFMDKVYGIKIVDHTAFSRKYVGISMNDQTHGLLYHNLTLQYDFFAHLFLGNLLQKSEDRQMGGSVLFEKNISKNTRWGSSLLLSQNNWVTLQRFAQHLRFNLEEGNSVLFEVGLLKDSPKSLTSTSSNQENQVGVYGLFENLMKLKRGLYFTSIGEYFKSVLDSDHSDQFKWHIGSMWYPMQSLETRFELINYKTISPSKVMDGGWVVQVQAHISL